MLVLGALDCFASLAMTLQGGEENRWPRHRSSSAPRLASRLTAGSTRRRSIATMQPIWHGAGAAAARPRPATCWRPAAAPASMWSHFARQHPAHRLVAERSQRRSICAASRRGGRMRGSANIRPPLRIDLADPDWCPAMRDGSGPGPLLAVFCANVIHIAPWRGRRGPVRRRGALSAAATGGCFCTARSSATADTPRSSNAVFDTSLRAANAGMGRARSRRSAKRSAAERRPDPERTASRCRPTIWCWCSTAGLSLREVGASAPVASAWRRPPHSAAHRSGRRESAPNPGGKADGRRIG